MDSHAGHDHATQPDTPVDADLTPDKAYVLKKNDNGSYQVTVQGRSGTTFYTSEALGAKPTFMEANQDVLEIADRSGKVTGGHWAVYCDIQNHRVSRKYNFVLGNLDSHVAFVEHRSGEFHVFVSDVFDESVYFKGYALEGAIITETSFPQIEYTMKGSTMTVTYLTEEGTKTMDIKLFA